LLWGLLLPLKLALPQTPEKKKKKNHPIINFHVLFLFFIFINLLKKKKLESKILFCTCPFVCIHKEAREKAHGRLEASEEIFIFFCGKINSKEQQKEKGNQGCTVYSCFMA
jgi:hypothetical protein